MNSRARGEVHFMKKIIQQMESLLNRVIVIQQFIAYGLLLLMMTLITADVIGRNLFNKPLKGTFEMTELSSEILVFFTLEMTHRHGQHISIRFIADKLSNKTPFFVDSFIELVIFCTLLIMSIHVFQHATRVMVTKMATTDLHVVIYPFPYVASFAIVPSALVAL